MKVSRKQHDEAQKFLGDPRIGVMASIEAAKEGKPMLASLLNSRKERTRGDIFWDSFASTMGEGAAILTLVVALLGWWTGIQAWWP